jgi:hypothetical protein
MSSRQPDFAFSQGSEKAAAFKVSCLNECSQPRMEDQIANLPAPASARRSSGAAE